MRHPGAANDKDDAAATRAAIEVLQGQEAVDLIGKHIAWETNDGRCVEARAKNAEAKSRQWEIMAAGRKGLEAC